MVGVNINNELITSATGENIKIAAQQAAEQALEILKHEKSSENQALKLGFDDIGLPARTARFPLKNKFKRAFLKGALGLWIISIGPCKHV